jgi:hypothetical protein
MTRLGGETRGRIKEYNKQKRFVLTFAEARNGKQSRDGAKREEDEVDGRTQDDTNYCSCLYGGRGEKVSQEKVGQNGRLN